MKTLELEGAALDLAVTMCEKREGVRFKCKWEQVGPIIEREGITIELERRDEGLPDIWAARMHCGKWVHAGADSPLVAAMRCYIRSKLGDEVEISKELNNHTA